MNVSVETYRVGSRVAVALYGEVRLFHPNHISSCSDKRGIASNRNRLERK